MRIKTLELPKGELTLKRVVFFTETSKYDFVFNHIVCLVEDKQDPEGLIKASIYNLLPRKCFATDRRVEVKIGTLQQQLLKPVLKLRKGG